MAGEIVDRDPQRRALDAQFADFSTIFDSMNVLVYVADMQTYEVLFINTYGKQLFGDDAVGRPCWSVLQSGQSGPCAFCTNHFLIRDGQPQPPYAWEFQNTITQRWYFIIDRAIRWSDGHLVRMEVAVDITERKQAEEFRQQYLALVSHDLRNPLNVIALRAETLKARLAARGLVEEAAMAGALMRGTAQMARMIDDLSESAHLESGQFELDRAPVDLGKLTREVARSLELAGEPARIAVVEPAARVIVSADRDRIVRVLENLIGNALKYSPAPAPVEVSVVADEPGRTATVTVRDQGQGIAAADRQRLFQRYFRTAAGKRAGGLGLGLYTARLIVDAHGGTIGVDSAPGEGSRFRFTLPLSPPA